MLVSLLLCLGLIGEPTVPFEEGPLGFSSLYGRSYELADGRRLLTLRRLLNELDGREPDYQTQAQPLFWVLSTDGEVDEVWVDVGDEPSGTCATLKRY